MTNSLALIIEDDENLADIFALALQNVGFETEIISDGQEALNRLSVVVPVLVLLDLHLPHVSGETILRQILADKRLVDTRVILATADATLAKMLGAESDLTLLKPISPKQLQILASRFIDRE